MLTGKTPYEGDSSMAIMMKHINEPPPAIFCAWPACPMPLGRLVGKMVAKRRQERHASYEELVADLMQVHEKLRQTESIAPVATTPAPAAMVNTVPKARQTDAEVTTQAKSGNTKLIYTAAGVCAAVALAGLLWWSPWKAGEVTRGKGQAETAERQPAATVTPIAAPPEPPRQEPAAPVTSPVPSPSSTPIAQPATAAVAPASTPPPTDALVLFDGKDISAWKDRRGEPCPWKILEDGSLETVPRTGDIATEQKFRDFQMHLEFWLPKLPPSVKDQARANSGVFLQGLYEIQVLDSYDNPTHPMGGCGSIFKIKDPDNADAALKPPETWNTYDITFRAARLDAAGNKTENARVTLVWNGVKVHDNAEIPGPTLGNKGKEGDAGPIRLQDHGGKVRYRNIWIQPLDDGAPAMNAAAPTSIAPANVAAAPDTSGFQPLFNGRDLTGWVPMKSSGRDDTEHEPTTGGWNVQNGELVCATSQTGWLKTERQYGDYVLRLEFKLLRDSNSDVYIRCPTSGPIARVGMAIQILDPNYRGKQFPPEKLTGAIYGVVGSPAPPVRPPGEWNSMEIRCEGDNVEVTLNGTRTASANMSQNPALQSRPRSGYIGIGNWHGEANGMAFRNIRIKELAATTPSPAPPPPSAAAFRPLFNGKDLAGWTPMKTTGSDDQDHRPATGGWRVRDGEIECATEIAGWLKTERQYSDFVLQLEFKLRPGGNSGVFIRSPESGHTSIVGMEIQMIDADSLSPSARSDPRQLSGAICRVAGTLDPPLRPMGEWNSMEIRCEGDNVEVTLNGTRTASADMGRNPALQNRPRSGYIGLSNWRGRAVGTVFRNIRIKELGASAAVPATPTDDAFAREVAALPAVQQVARVVAKLKELNPNFDGKQTHKIEGGAVTELAISTVGLRNLAPVSALKQLKKLTIAPWAANQKGVLADLSPLRELSLAWLYCQNNPVSDLAPLKGLPLTVLGCGGTQVSDLSPLAGMKLTVLSVNDTAVSDLAPLAAMPLTVLWCNNTSVTDFSPLGSSPLQELRCDFQPQRDAGVLRGIPTLRKINDQPAAALLKQTAVSTAGGDIGVLIVTGVDLPAHDWRSTGPAIRNELQKDPRIKVEILNDIYRLDSMDLAKFQVVLLNFYTKGKPDPNEQARDNLKNFVNRGGGLVIFHSTCGSFRDWPEFRDLAGKVMGQGKLEYDKQGPMRVKIANANHPITRGMQPYETNDELYAFLSGRKAVQVLATAHAKSTGSDEPMAFVFDYGKGRVFHFVLGHDVQAIQTDGTAELLRRGTAWAAGREPAPLTAPQRPVR
jgi:type 1 glutamine amidotransferase